MTPKGRTVLKGYYNAGDMPTEEQFSDLIDSFPLTGELNNEAAIRAAAIITEAAARAAADNALQDDINALATTASGIVSTTVNGTQGSSTTLNVTNGSGFVDTAYVAYETTGGDLEYRQIDSGGGTNALTLDSAHGGVTDGATVSMITVSEFLAKGGYGTVPGRLDGIDAMPGAMRLKANVSAASASITTRTPVNGIIPDASYIVIDPFTTECEVRKVNSIVGDTISFSGGLTYGHSADDPVLWTSRRVWDVTWFGAVGDGSTDDTTAIQRALNQCSDGDALFFGDMFFTATGGLTITKSIHMIGNGYTSGITHSGNTTLLTVGPGGSQLVGFKMHNMRLRGNTGTSAQGLFLDDIDFIEVSGNWFENWGLRALYIEDCIEDPRITNNVFNFEDSFSTSGDEIACEVTGDVHDLFFIANMVEGCKIGLKVDYFASTTVNFTIHDNNFDDIDEYPVTLAGSGDISIVGNLFEQSPPSSPATVDIASITAAGGTVTVNTSTAHGRSTGDHVFIDITVGYNGAHGPITVTDTDTFTFASVRTGSESGTGTVRKQYAAVRIDFTNTFSDHNHSCMVNDNRFRQIDADAIHIIGGVNHTVNDNKFVGLEGRILYATGLNQETGAVLTGEGFGLTFVGNNAGIEAFTGMFPNEVYLKSFNNAVLASNVFVQMLNECIVLDGCSNGTINSNTIRNVDQANISGTSTVAALRLTNCLNFAVMGNHISGGAPDASILETGTSDYNNIIGNVVDDAITTAGANSASANNVTI